MPIELPQDSAINKKEKTWESVLLFIPHSGLRIAPISE